MIKCSTHILLFRQRLQRRLPPLRLRLPFIEHISIAIITPNEPAMTSISPRKAGMTHKQQTIATTLKISHIIRIIFNFIYYKNAE